MKTRLFFYVVLGLLAISCGRKNREQKDKISGVYAREYSFKVIHAERGDTIGERTVRDTIYIRQRDEVYEVSNHKWSLNDYDSDGWQSMQHSEDRPAPTYMANYDQETSSLRAVDDALNLIHLDAQNQQMIRTKDKQYRKLATTIDK